jgi:hypothetical protein
MDGSALQLSFLAPCSIHIRILIRSTSARALVGGMGWINVAVIIW